MEQKMEALLQSWDGELVITHYHQTTNAWIFIAIHSTRLGPAAGGTRMKVYPEPSAALQDVLKLATGMTYKFAVPGVARGGGKAVIALPNEFDESSRALVLRAYGTLVQQLGGLFYTATDVGTSAADMDIVAETGSPYIWGRTPAAGGSGDSGPITALGIFAGIQVVCEQVFGSSSLAGRRVLVQGVGKVGRAVIGHLQQAGATVLFSDINPDAIRYVRDKHGLEFVPAQEIYTTECDVFSPCALGGILNAESIGLLRCRAVAGGANNQLSTAADAVLLKARGILYAPDFVITLGGALAVPNMEQCGWSLDYAEQEVIRTIRDTLRQIFTRAGAEDSTTEAAARAIADERLAAHERKASL